MAGRPSIVLAGGETLGALAAVRALREAGYAAWTADSAPGGYARLSRASAGSQRVPDARRAPDEFVRALAELAERVGAAAVLPGTDATLLALAGREAAFPDGIRIATSPRAVLDRALDKRSLADLAGVAGLEIPETLKLTPGEAAARTQEIPYPAIIKPLSSEVGEDGSLVHAAPVPVSGPEELHRAVATLPGDGWLVQPLVPGRLSAVCGVAWEGRLVCASHQIAARIWPPACGVTAYAEVVEPDRVLEQGVARMLADLPWSGLFEAQFIRPPDGRALFIDLNLRVYGSLALAVGAGLNLPGVWADLLLGRTPRIGQARVGTRLRSEERDLRALAALVRAGRPAAALRGLLPRPRTAHAIVRIDDPLPGLASVRKLRRPAP